MGCRGSLAAFCGAEDEGCADAESDCEEIDADIAWLEGDLEHPANEREQPMLAEAIVTIRTPDVPISIVHGRPDTLAFHTLSPDAADITIELADLVFLAIAESTDPTDWSWRAV